MRQMASQSENSSYNFPFRFKVSPWHGSIPYQILTALTDREIKKQKNKVVNDREGKKDEMGGWTRDRKERGRQFREKTDTDRQGEEGGGGERKIVQRKDRHRQTYTQGETRWCD